MEAVKIESKETIQVSEGFYISYGKLLLDYVVSVCALLVIWPILLIVALLIKMDSKGPAIFKQPRIGKDGREFYIYKFRTMYITAPREGKSPERPDDVRITRVGRFLRKTSIDELPQLFNILKGDMSLVGPRPEQKSIVEKYYGYYERQRFLVKPGITGLWQLSMDRTKPIHENLQYDYEYIRGISFWLDLKIICKTVLVLIRSNTF